MKKLKDKIIIITGPTAAGKTELSIELAHKYQGLIISADSRQIYRYMDIGTATPKKEDLKRVEHKLIDELNPDEDFTIYKFVKRVNTVIFENKNEKKLFICGGTPLYINGLINGLNDIPDSDPDFRADLEKRDSQDLHDELMKFDPARAESIHVNNRKRVIRSLEIIRLTGKKVSDLFEEQKKDSNLDYLYFVINRPREILYDRINKRVELMVKQGFVQEVEKLFEMGYSANANAFSSIGYPEIAEYLEKKVTLDEAIKKIQKKTRNFARRQLIWFRKQKNAIWIDPGINDFKQVISEMSSKIEAFYDF